MDEKQKWTVLIGWLFLVCAGVFFSKSLVDAAWLLYLVFLAPTLTLINRRYFKSERSKEIFYWVRMYSGVVMMACALWFKFI